MDLAYGLIPGPIPTARPKMDTDVHKSDIIIIIMIRTLSIIRTDIALNFVSNVWPIIKADITRGVKFNDMPSFTRKTCAPIITWG